LALEEAIRRERALLEPVRAKADYLIDTTAMSTAKLRGELLRLFAPGAERVMEVSVISFGYKFGLPIEADLVFDVRFLPNPFYIDELRGKNGADPEVQRPFSTATGRRRNSSAAHAHDGLPPAALLREEGQDRPRRSRSAAQGAAPPLGGRDELVAEFYPQTGALRVSEIPPRHDKRVNAARNIAALRPGRDAGCAGLPGKRFSATGVREVVSCLFPRRPNGSSAAAPRAAMPA
jgi:hypothetical protein